MMKAWKPKIYWYQLMITWIFLMQKLLAKILHMLRHYHQKRRYFNKSKIFRWIIMIWWNSRNLKKKLIFQGPCCNEEEEHSKSSLRDFFVVLALTFHAILEGIAVGLEPEVNDVWLLFSGELPDIFRCFKICISI